MEIDEQTLPSMAEFSQFEKTFLEYVKATAGKACLYPKSSFPRLRDIHYAWMDDLSRVEGREANLQDGLDHFKQCGHLAYWVRRYSPVVEYDDLAALWEKPDQLYPDEIERRDLLFRYGAEYIAFNFGFEICQYYELERTDRTTPPTVPSISKEYLQDICHMLKFKHVSPHSIYLIYRSIFI